MMNEKPLERVVFLLVDDVIILDMHEGSPGIGGNNSKVERTVKKERILKPGIRPIMACLGNAWNFDLKEMDESVDLNKDKVLDIDYYDRVVIHEKNNSRHSGYMTYVISAIDERNKMSSKFLNCTGIVAVAVDKLTGKNISFISHQDPDKFLSDHKKSFRRDLVLNLRELIARAEPQTVDIVVFGGNFIDGYLSEYEKDYEDSIRLISKVIQSEAGFEPLVITGPKITSGGDAVYFDTEKRRLFIARPKVSNSSLPYKPSELKGKIKEWRILRNGEF